MSARIRIIQIAAHAVIIPVKRQRFCLVAEVAVFVVTFDFRYPYVHRMANFALWSLNYSMVKSSYVRAISIISKSIVNF